MCRRDRPAAICSGHAMGSRAAAAAAALLPIAWPLQMAAGIVAYMAAGWLLSAFTLSDWTLMRQAMRAPRTSETHH